MNVCVMSISSFLCLRNRSLPFLSFLFWWFVVVWLFHFDHPSTLYILSLFFLVTIVIFFLLYWWLFVDEIFIQNKVWCGLLLRFFSSAFSLVILFKYLLPWFFRRKFSALHFASTFRFSWWLLIFNLFYYRFFNSFHRLEIFVLYFALHFLIHCYKSGWLTSLTTLFFLFLF